MNKKPSRRKTAKPFARIDRWHRHFLYVSFGENIVIDSIVDQRDWVRTRHTYYKMCELFLDRRKNIARSPHALMLLSELRRDARRTQVADVRCMYVLYIRDANKFSISNVLCFSKLRCQMSPPCGEIFPMWLYHQVPSNDNSDKNIFAEIWLFNR